MPTGAAILVVFVSHPAADCASPTLQKFHPVNKVFVKVLAVVSVVVALYAVAAVVATFTQLAAAADRVHLGAGQPLFWSLLALFGALLLYPLVLLLRLPKAMQPPEDASSPDHAVYRDWLERHLAQHPDAAVAALASSGDVPAALQALSARADEFIRGTASNVFVSTALMQNGRLDGLVVLATQLRLIWQIGALYNLRPSPRQLWYLYSNVGGAMLVAAQLEELDFTELAGPLVSSVVPSLAAAVPGLQGVGNLLVNSLANGSANAFLTLRVGLIAKSYCAPLARPERAAVRKSATVAALSMLGAITQEKGGQIVKSVWAGAGSAVGKAAGAVVGGAKRATSATGAAVTGAVSSVAGAAAGASKAVGNATLAAGGKVAGAGRSISHATSDVIDSTAGLFQRKEKLNVDQQSDAAKKPPA